MNLGKLLFWRPKNATLQQPEWWRQILQPRTSGSGISVGMESAVTVAAVWACVRIIAESISSLPLFLYERTSDGGKSLAMQHPLFSLLHALPNDEQTILDLLEFKLSNLLLRGTTYSEINRSLRGAVGEIIPMDANYMHVTRGADGGLIFDYQEPGNSKVLLPGQVWRVSGIGRDGVTGVSPIALGRESIGVALGAELQAGKLFANGMQIPSVFEKDGTLSDTAYERLKKSLESEYAGASNAFQSMILEDGLKLKQIGFTAEDSQFLESRKFQIAEIARWFRVPLHMLNELDKATFSNIEHQSQEFVTHTLRPWIKRLELSMLRDLLLPSERARYFSEFKIDGLLRGDIKSRYEAYGMAIRDGWMNRNQVRVLENMNPAPGLDEYLVPLNMTETGEQSSTQNIVTQEIRAVLKEYGTRDRDEFNSWVDKYYMRLQDSLIADGVDVGTAESYAGLHADELKHADDIKSIVSRWAQHAPKELAA